jgi:hypothetical protein
MYIIIIMKLKQVGQKLHDFKNYIGNKTYGGIKSLGNKIYDNRYKIGAGLALTAGGLLLNNYMSKSAPTVNPGAAASPSLYQTLKKQGAFTMPLKLPPIPQRKQVSGLFPPPD